MNFNSILVRLKPDELEKQALNRGDFNSILVRLKLKKLLLLAQVKFDFNSILVRLKLVKFKDNNLANQDFNSILVRLKLYASTTGIFSIAFQFHLGSIKAKGSLCSIFGKFYFNSILVRLKRKVFREDVPYILDFNSILVRLKHNPYTRPDTLS